MATKKKPPIREDYGAPPATLEGHCFYGLELDNEQKIFRDAIWNPENDIIFCDACAGVGNETELLRIVDLFDFFQQGTSKTIKKDKIKEPLYSMVAKYATDKGVKGNELKSFTITNMDGLLHEVESYIRELHLPELTYKVKAENQKEILGYVDLTTRREEDRRKLFVLDVYEIQNKWNQKGGIFKVRVQTKSIGSGKTANLSIAPYLASQKPVHEGDILVNPVVKKDSKGYWNLLDYDIYV